MAKPQSHKNKNSIKHFNTDQNLSVHSMESGTYNLFLNVFKLFLIHLKIGILLMFLTKF